MRNNKKNTAISTGKGRLTFVNCQRSRKKKTESVLTAGGSTWQVGVATRGILGGVGKHSTPCWVETNSRICVQVVRGLEDMNGLSHLPPLEVGFTAAHCALIQVDRMKRGVDME